MLSNVFLQFEHPATQTPLSREKLPHTAGERHTETNLNERTHFILSLSYPTHGPQITYAENHPFAASSERTHLTVSLPPSTPLTHRAIVISNHRKFASCTLLSNSRKAGSL